MWWSPDYPYRRNIVVTAPDTETLPVDHPVLATIDLSVTYGQGKLRSDYEDIEVLYERADATPWWEVLPRTVTLVGDTLEVRFVLAEPMDAAEIEDSYFIYYGNPDLSNAPTRPSFSTEAWPIQVQNDSLLIAYTRLGDYWEDGQSNMANAQASLEFAGVGIRIIADKSIASGIAQVQVDTDPWEEVDLFSFTPQDEVPVFTREDLSPGVHRIRYRVSGKKNPSALDGMINVQRFEYVKPVTVIDLGEEIDQLQWSSVFGGDSG